MACLSQELLERFIIDRYTPEQHAEVQAHVASCTRCAARLYWAQGEDTQRRDPQAESTVSSPVGAQSSPPVLPLGTIIDRYLVLQPVGEGGMGVVYAAYDPELDRHVAIKLLRPMLDDRIPGEAQARMLREAQSMARISHPNVMAVHDVGPFRDQVFMAMELAEGTNLESWLLKRQRSWREVLDVFLAAGRGLAAAHAAGLVHRDFKPANVLVSNDGRVRVTDFGLARLVEEPVEGRAGVPSPALPGASGGALPSAPVTESGALVGTPFFMAPEQLLGRRADALSDQFSFCTALYYALYLRRPFEPRHLAGVAAQLEAASGEPEPQGAILSPPREPRVPGWIKRAMMRGLALSPARRFASMEALISRLAAPPTLVRSRWAIAAGLVLLAGVASTWRTLLSREAALCTGAEQKLSGVWDPQVQRRISETFAASGIPYAPTSFQRMKSVLDTYAGAWVEMHTDACRATRLRGEQTEAALSLRMVCLERRLQNLGALTQVLAQADHETVDNAVAAASELPPVAGCADVGSLMAPISPPESAHARAEIASVTTGLARAKALRDAGRFRESISISEAEATAARRIDYPPLLAEALCEQGWDLLRNGQGKDAESLLTEAWGLAEQAHLDEVRVMAATGMASSLDIVEGHPEQALVWGGLGVAALKRTSGHPELGVDLRMQIAAAHYYSGHLEEAVTEIERALSIADATYGARSAKKAITLAPAGVMYRAVGEVEKAIRALEESIALGDATEGPDHPERGYPHSTVALVYADQGDTARAYSHARRSVEIWERALGTEHHGLAVGLDALAFVLNRQGRHAEALDAARRAVAIDEKVLGANHIALAGPLDRMGEAYLRTDRAKEALPLLERALGLQTPEPDILAEVRFHLAAALSVLGRDRGRARELATEARDSYLRLHNTARAAEAWGLVAQLGDSTAGMSRP